ncbi:transposase [Sagittula marina]|uniref:Transposase n=1 Tax=Sagittula marina TaxID=943940 RepID=A0A7W6DSU4_9RHOB|nr:transposase [Sagittula marina]
MARDLMSDEEWAFFEHFILAVRAPNGRKPTNHRLVLDGIFWIARTGAPWRDLPAEFGKWSSVCRQFRRWTLAGLWEQIMDALNESGAVPHALQMIDSTVVRAHHPLPGRALREQCPEREAAGAKGDSATGSWPLTRWLHDQDPPPRQCSRAAHEDGDHRGTDLRLSRF